ncbi:hypothetical protein N7509_011520, partial [Penicillium cosmopolitanum]
CPFANSSTAVLMQGRQGGSLGLLQDTQLIETLAHFSRERIPERVVHAKAVGSFGEFEATRDCSDFTSAKFLSTVGKKTPVLQRVSTVGPESGSADTSRDGVVFFIRDPIKFPSMNRSHKRHPQTQLPDQNMDFHVGSPEGIYQLLVLFSDRGTFKSVRYMNSYSGHTYKFTNPDGSFKYAKVHVKTQQGVENLSSQDATRIAGEDPDFMIRDMFEAIDRGEYPVWNVYEFPLQQIGLLTMNRNLQNYFADIEQAAFSPSTMVPGIATSADPVLQARLFAYPDAARYHLGVNYQQLPTNAAKAQFYQDQKGISASALALHTEHEKWAGEVSAYISEITDDHFVQPAAFLGLFGCVNKDLGSKLRQCTEAAIQAA